jgi:hypothetical protein
MLVPEMTCPRCGAPRTENFRWCRKCGLDFQKPPKEIVPDNAGRAVRRPDEIVGGPAAPPRVDIRQVDDRANMARKARAELDVRCLGTVGGVVRAIVGLVLFAAIGGLLGPAIGAVGLIVGIPIGWWIGVRTALGWLAR